MVESSSSTNSAIKAMIGIGTASMILSLSMQPNYEPKTLTKENMYSYECTSENPCDYFLKNEVMPKAIEKFDLELEPEVKIVHSFVNNIVEYSEKSPPHFSKTVDKHFWDLA